MAGKRKQMEDNAMMGTEEVKEKKEEKHKAGRGGGILTNKLFTNLRAHCQGHQRDEIHPPH